jgi:hypothetical protein
MLTARSTARQGPDASSAFYPRGHPKRAPDLVSRMPADKFSGRRNRQPWRSLLEKP